MSCLAASQDSTHPSRSSRAVAAAAAVRVCREQRRHDHRVHFPPMSSIELQGVAKNWGEVVALRAVDLRIAEGSFCVLLGPSGCGKSTTLRIIAGLDTASAGQVLIDGRDVTGLPPAQRGIAMVFQNYALFPHLNVADNITFGLSVRRLPAAERAQRLGRGRRAARPGRAAAAQALAAVRRPAAARGAGPRAGRAGQGLPDGRAAVQPRRAAAPGDAARTARAAAPARADGGLRDPRPGRGDEHGRPGRAAEQGPRSNRTAAPRDLYARPATHLRRALHRHAADEPGAARRRPHRRQRCRVPACTRHSWACARRPIALGGDGIRRVVQSCRIPRRRPGAALRRRQPEPAGARRRPDRRSCPARAVKLRWHAGRCARLRRAGRRIH